MKFPVCLEHEDYGFEEKVNLDYIISKEKFHVRIGSISFVCGVCGKRLATYEPTGWKKIRG